jgi:hypothetical protein
MAMHTIHGASIRSLTLQRARRAETSRGGPTGALGAAGLAALLPVGVLDAALSSADAAPAGRNPKATPPTVAATTGSECLIGGSTGASGCVVTSQCC